MTDELSPIDLRLPNVEELLLARHVALLLGDIPGPVPDWFRLATAEKLRRGESRPSLDRRQAQLVQLVAKVRLEREEHNRAILAEV